jgi:peptide/nickel transport system substrate-binding protein
MNRQATSLNDTVRKQAVARVQQIVADQQPFIYLVYPNTLVAISPRLQGVEPALLEPELVWNVERLRLQGSQ